MTVEPAFPEPAFLDELRRLVGFPSVSSDTTRAQSVRECAAYLQERLARLDAETRLIETERHPLLVARAELDPSFPTVTFYNHYDVQPIAQADEWRTDPFTLAVRGDRYYGRGASDDKGNLVLGLLAAERARELGLKLNLEFIYEGEEEIGSPNFRTAIVKVRDLLKPDAIAALDSNWLSRDRPCIKYGCRGLLYMFWDLRTADASVHSGTLGGVARNPIAELTAAAAECCDPKTGEILIPGVYANLMEPPPAEVNHWMAAELPPEELCETYGLRGLKVTDRESMVRALFARPTFEIHGCVGGYMRKNGVMTVIPGEAQLLVSMRLVPNQDPDQVFELVQQFVATVNPDIRVTKAEAARSFLDDPNSAPILAAAEALSQAFGLPVLKAPSAATIGAAAHMQEVLGRPPTFFMAFSLSEHSVHGPNEHFDRSQAERGLKTLVDFLQKMAT